MQLLQLLISGISQGCILGLVALGFVLIYKATETVNFAQGELMMLGASIAWLLADAAHWPVLAACAAAIALMALGGPAVDGLYGTNSILNPYFDDESQAVRDWAAKYKEKFGEDPAVFSVYGYNIADVFCVAAAKASANLTLDSFHAAIESTIFRAPMFGGPDLRFTGKDRLGTRKVHISQIVNGKWKAITPLMDPPAE